MFALRQRRFETVGFSAWFSPANRSRASPAPRNDLIREVRQPLAVPSQYTFYHAVSLAGLRGSLFANRTDAFSGSNFTIFLCREHSLGFGAKLCAGERLLHVRPDGLASCGHGGRSWRLAQRDRIL